MVPPCSDRISRVPPYSNGSPFYGYGAVTHLAQLPNWFAFIRPHGLVRVRSPLLTESLLMSFPTGTEMFQFPAFALKTLCVQVSSTWFAQLMRALPEAEQHQSSIRWVSPFGDPRIKGCSPLPTAYRRVPRPSSPLIAKASTKRPSCA